MGFIAWTGSVVGQGACATDGRIARRQQLAQPLLQFALVQTPEEATSYRNGDRLGFLRDDDRDRICLLRQSQSRAVPSAEALVFDLLCQGQGSAGGHQGFSLNHHGLIMQR